MTIDKRKLLLAIDTATSMTGIALFDGGLVAEMVWRSGRNQTVELLPAIQDMLQRQREPFERLGAVAVSLGPGSFNGLRVGISTAKGLALASDLACIGIDTLRAAAYQFWGQADKAIRPLYDAGRGEVATALYVGGENDLEIREHPRLVPLLKLVEQIREPTLVCGELTREWESLLLHRAGKLVSFPPLANRVRRPAFMAELAWRRWEADDVNDIVSLEPIYLREPAISLQKL